MTLLEQRFNGADEVIRIKTWAGQRDVPKAEKNHKKKNKSPQLSKVRAWKGKFYGIKKD